MFYAVFRTFCEFFREPDQQVGYFFGVITMGQMLSIAMFAVGAILKFTHLGRNGGAGGDRPGE
jgi:phosphatidylglycerol---prolipoprotein diacylglyceryl transferase